MHSNMKRLAWRGKCVIFTNAEARAADAGLELSAVNTSCENSRPDAAFQESRCAVCTKSGQRLVDGLHSIENTCTYKRVIFVDEKNRRSTRGSFFDSFLSFSGWCGVRGSSGVTVLIARLGRRVGKGL